MVRTLIQSTEEDNYELVVSSKEGLNLLDDDETDRYVGKIICSEIVRLCYRFIDRTETCPISVSVSGSVKTLVSKHIIHGDADCGEMRKVAGQYDDDPYLFITYKNRLRTVHVSTTCKVKAKRFITITGVCDEDR